MVKLSGAINHSSAYSNYKSDSLQLLLVISDGRYSANWVQDETWAVSVDLPDDAEIFPTVIFFDRNGEVLLAWTRGMSIRTKSGPTESIKFPEFVGLQTYIYADTDRDGVPNIDELLSGTDHEVSEGPDAFDIGSDPDAFQRATRVENATVGKAGGPNFRHFTFNTKAGLLQDQTIRQAIVYALDRQAIAASDLASIDWPVGPLNNHIFLQGQAGFVDTTSATGLDFNPEKARALLDEAGWTVGEDGIREKDKQKLIVSFSQLATVKASENEALQAQSMLKDVGIQLDIVTVPVARFGPTLTGKEFEIIAFSWIGTPYPFSSIKQIYGSGSESNYAQLSLPEVDELAEQISAETDAEKRIELANKVDRIIWENVHTLPLYQRPELIATRRDLANYGAFGLSSVQ